MPRKKSRRETSPPAPVRKDPVKAGPPRETGWTSLLAGLGIFGYEAIEPVILAALISAEPLLLIGDHGTGKSYLLNRICEALELESRHYNASLLNYDDLVGYPLPGAGGHLEFVRTPASIWGAQAVFLDEISRCRPDLQNKLFPIIHERKVQGIPLERLLYRWSAINPPATEEDPDGWHYRGSEPLDAALADRFAFIVITPAWNDLSASQQKKLLRNADDPLDTAGAQRLRTFVDSGRGLWKSLLPALKDELSGYVCLLMALLEEAGIPCSPRRAVLLLRNISAVHAAHLQLLAEPELSQSAFLAVTHSLPHSASGHPVDRLKVLAAHREAWRIEGLKEEDPLRHLYLERDPVRRVIRASCISRLAVTDFSTIVADTLAGLPEGGQHAVAAFLFESGAAGRLVAAVADQCGALYGLLTTPQEFSETVSSVSSRHRVWKHICQKFALLQGGTPETQLVENLLVGLFSAGKLDREADVDRVLEEWQKARVKTRERVAA